MYSGVVVPFAGISFGHIHRHGGEIYCCDDSFLYRLQGNVWKPVGKTEGADNVHVDDSGIWLEYLDARPPYSRLMDEAGNVLRIEPYAPSRTITIGNELIFRSSDDEQSLCKKVGLDDAVVVSEYSRLYEPPVKALDRVVIEMRDGVIRCLDADFCERWTLPARKRVRGHLKQSPQVHENSGNIFINFEAIPESGEYRSVVVSSESGAVIWELLFTKEPSFSNLIGDNIYVVCDGELGVYDFMTGREIRHAMLPEPLVNVRWLLPHNHSLIVANMPRIDVSASEPFAIYVLDATTLNITQHLTIPMEVANSKPKAELTSFGDLVVLPLWSPSLDSPYSATAVLCSSTSSDVVDGILPLPNRPDFRITKMENSKGESEYVVTVSHPNIDELWVWSAWTLKDLALSVGNATVVNKKSFDKNHNGVIHFAPDLSVLDVGAEAKLRDMLEAVEHSLRFVKPGLKKNAFRFPFMRLS